MTKGPGNNLHRNAVIEQLTGRRVAEFMNAPGSTIFMRVDACFLACSDKSLPKIIWTDISAIGVRKHQFGRGFGDLGSLINLSLFVRV